MAAPPAATLRKSNRLRDGSARGQWHAVCDVERGAVIAFEHINEPGRIGLRSAAFNPVRNRVNARRTLSGGDALDRRSPSEPCLGESVCIRRLSILLPAPRVPR